MIPKLPFESMQVGMWIFMHTSVFICSEKNIRKVLYVFLELSFLNTFKYELIIIVNNSHW